MSDYRKALKQLEEQKRNNVQEGKVREYDLSNGLANRVIEEHWDKQDEKWKTEYAQEIMKNKE